MDACMGAQMNGTEEAFALENSLCAPYSTLKFGRCCRRCSSEPTRRPVVLFDNHINSHTSPNLDHVFVGLGLFRGIRDFRCPRCIRYLWCKELSRSYLAKQEKCYPQNTQQIHDASNVFNRSPDSLPPSNHAYRWTSIPCL